jgi:hypothetical protein
MLAHELFGTTFDVFVADKWTMVKMELKGVMDKQLPWLGIVQPLIQMH